jgi:hypothetical protein
LHFCLHLEHRFLDPVPLWVAKTIDFAILAIVRNYVAIECFRLWTLKKLALYFCAVPCWNACQEFMSIMCMYLHCPGRLDTAGILDAAAARIANMHATRTHVSSFANPFCNPKTLYPQIYPCFALVDFAKNLLSDSCIISIIPSNMRFSSCTTVYFSISFNSSGSRVIRCKGVISRSSSCSRLQRGSWAHN